MRFAVVALLAAAASTGAGAQPSDPRATDPCDPSKWKLPVDGHYNTEGKIADDKLNVHLIPHSHDDPGWLVTVDQYYMERVQFILDTVIEELLLDPSRKFMFVEQSFFQRWWHQQGEDIKAITKHLVKEGRLDLSVNGGWSMHDEATPHYSAMVDQTAYGHQLLMDEFGITPRIGWQIDPFGHSATQGSLLSEGVGFDALYFARIDYQDYGARRDSKNLEFIWRPSKSRGKYSQVFTGEIQNTYTSPGKFDFGNQDNWVQDDPALHDFNVCDQVNSFVKEATDRSSVQKGKHLFIPMGNDFAFDNARRWYKNMDKLIHYINQDNRINVLYSNLSYYTDLKRAENLTWAVKTDDFFPYASGQDDYWSGFFTSRPTLKRFARVSNILLQQVRQIDAVYQSHHTAELHALQRAVGLVQHHDGLSGTEKQAVSNDYALRLNDGVIEAEKGLNEILFVIGAKEPFHLCLLANTSVCDVSTKNQEFEVLVHNALARKTVETISIPLTHPLAMVDVIDGSGVVRHQDVFKALPAHPEADVAPYSLVFSTELSPLSATRFRVRQKGASNSANMRTVDDDDDDASKKNVIGDDKTVSLENDLVRVDINTQTGFIAKLVNKKKGIELPLSATVEYYHAYSKDHPCSGAYAFRPDGNKTYPVGQSANGHPSATLVDLGLDSDLSSASRVAFKIGDWVMLEYRLNDGDEFVEIEWTVGPVPIGDNIGKEVIVRFDTKGSIKSDKTVYTDSNGLEFVKRVRDHRDTWNLVLHDDSERVAANYFPITTGAYIKDSDHQLNIATDRAQGAASLQDGQLEVMVHRRLLEDDNKGVGEHLNETESVYDASKKTEVTKGLTVRGNFFINVDSAHDGMQSLRSKMEKQFFRPLIALRKPDPSDDGAWKLPWLTVNEFPPNVGLTTLVELSKQCVMARLSHLFAVDEHSELSKAATVDFGALFSVKGSAVSEVKELSLTGVTDVRDGPSSASEWNTEGESEEDGVASPSIPVYGTSVVLQPIEVRTFRVCFGKGEDVEDAEDVEDMYSVLKSLEWARLRDDNDIDDAEETAVQNSAPVAMDELLAVA